MNSARALAALFLMLGAASGLAQSDPPAPPVPQVQHPHGNMSLDCKLCHVGNTWSKLSTNGFDHASTGFALEGLHEFVLCSSCHTEQEFAHVGTECLDCHVDTHRGRLGPNCTDCHSPQAWVNPSQMRREHNATAMPLVGAHERVDCLACHDGAVTGDYVGTPTECIFCHTEEYAATTEPDHLMAGFTTDCERCHGVFAASWGSNDFIHDQVFPLTGAHRTVDCAACHTDGFKGTPRDCVACHRMEYDNTIDPNHFAANFSTDCNACHTTTAWQPATFDHNTTGFALTGAHRTVDCLSCHSDGYSGTPADCFACHSAEYDGTNSPNHVASGFPVSCDDCHSTSAWEPANWNHDASFVLSSGPHREAWNSCTDCHVVQSDFSIFECFFCHEHNESKMADKHSEETGYQYLSAACLSCHPRGLD